MFSTASYTAGNSVLQRFGVSNPQSIEGSSLGGFTGHIATPSAGMFWDGSDLAISTGYTLIAERGGLSHIPYMNFGLFRQLEITAAMDAKDSAQDLLIGAKWRFLESGTTQAAAGVLGQIQEIGSTPGYGLQLFTVSTFQGAFLNQQAITSVLIGYTFRKNMTTDIDFSVGFDTPLLPSLFDGHVRFVFDIGNVSYSMNPSGNDPHRGIVNAGIRLNPIQLARSLRFTLNMYGLDLLDGKDRSFGAGLALQMDLN